ncbi:MAG TPA: ABC transporter permease [Bryobacteraceae bacterium]|nr:ABC transporter permease [Bryobacteraceae bacterium]
MRLFADLRYAWRGIVHSPGFALIAVLSVALGVGLNAAMFSYVDAVLLRPLPAPDPGRIVQVVSTAPGTRMGGISYPDYVDLRDQARALSALVCWEFTPIGISASRDAVAQMTLGVMVSGNFFSGLGIEIPIGRGFRAEEDSVPGRDLVAVISHSLWQRMYGSDPNIEGKKVRLSGAEFTIIGVAPADFSGPEAFVLPDVYVPVHAYAQAIPLADADFLTGRARRPMNVFGRLKPGVSVAQAQAEMTTIARRLAEQYPATNRDRSVAVMNYLQARYENDPSDAISALMLLGIAALVLVIACANVANLVLERGAARAKEIAIRMAIGGSRWQLVRQLFTESLLLALIGGAAGLGIAYAGEQLFNSVPLPSDFPISLGVRMDTRLLLFSLATAIATGLIFGLIPAFRVTSGDLSRTLKASDQGPGKARLWRGMFSGRNLLVMAQLTFSAVLLVLSAFFVKGFAAARSMNPGFRVDHTLFFSIDTSLVRYDEAKGRDFVKKLEDRLRDQPGITDASASWTIPFTAGEQQFSGVIVDGYQVRAGEEYPSAWVDTVDDHYFSLMEAPLARGRGFDSRDTKSSPRVAIVNEELARRMWPGRDAIGQTLRLGRADSPELQVIGVAKNEKYEYWAEPPLMAAYIPFSQNFKSHLFIEMRTEGDPAAMAAVARAQVRALDPDMPVIRVSTMATFYHDRFLLGPRLLAQMVTGIGVIGLMLAVIGLYGVVAYAVRRRTREIGIRMAIGARPADVLRMVLGQGMMMTAAGVVVGIGIASAAGNFLQNFAVGTSTHDPFVLLSVTAILAVVMVAACWMPARRASRVDPVQALRQE